MLAAMSEIMLQVVPFGFEHVVVLVFDLPAGASIAYNRLHRGVADGKVGHPGVFVDHCTAIFARGGQVLTQLTVSASVPARKGTCWV